MREISPAVGLSVDDCVKLLPFELKKAVEEIRHQKRERALGRVGEAPVSFKDSRHSSLKITRKRLR